MIDIEFDINKQKAIQTIVKFQNGKYVVPAIRELIQNSLDANSTEIRVKFDDKYVIVEDNGDGMTEEEIMNEFRVLFETSKGDNKAGEFGVGRTQIMNFGKTIWLTRDNSIYTDLKEFLGFKLNKRKQFVKGTKVICIFDAPPESYLNWGIRRSIKKILLPFGVRFFVNEQILKQYDLNKDFSDDNFDVFESVYADSKIYNIRLAVCNFKSNFEYCINSKRKMKTNFARNELLESDELVQDLYSKIREIETFMIKEKSKYNDNECEKTLSLLSIDRIGYNEVKHRSIILGINKRYSFYELKDKTIMFGDNDVWSKDCINKGHIVIDKKIKPFIEHIIKNKSLDILIDDRDPSEISDRGYHKNFEISNIRRNKIYGYIPFELNERVFKPYFNDDDFIKNVSVGDSDIDIFWGDEDNIFIDKQVIVKATSFVEAILKIWNMMCISYSNNYEFEVSFEEYKNDDHDIVDYDIEKIIRLTLPYVINFIKEMSIKYLKIKYEGI